MIHIYISRDVYRLYMVTVSVHFSTTVLFRENTVIHLSFDLSYANTYKYNGSYNIICNI